MLGGRIPPALDAHLRTHGALVFPTDPQAPVNPYRSTLYQPRELYDGLARARVRGHAGRPRLPLVARRRRPARRVRHPAAGDPRRLGQRRPRRVHRRRADRRGHGWSRLARGTDAVRRARRCSGHRLATAGLAVVTGGGPGAMEAANLGCLRPRRGRARATRSTGSPPCRRSPPTSGRGRRSALAVHDELAQAPVPEPRVQEHRHPDVVLRPRAAQRLLQRHRQVLLQRAARGRAARPVDRGAGRARGRGRHRAGGLPGRHPALLLARRAPRCRSSCSSGASTGPRWCRCGRP